MDKILASSEQIIVATPEQIKQIIHDEICKVVFFQPVQPEVPDKTDLDGACDHLEHQGYKVKKSTIYKLSSKNEIPCQRIGNRLIFSRKALTIWFETLLTQKSQFNASIELAKSAQRKLRKG